MNSLWRKSARITEASLTRDVSRLNCYAFRTSGLQLLRSAPEANVEFHNIVAAVGESQLNAMIPDVMQLLTLKHLKKHLIFKTSLQYSEIIQ